MVRNRNNALIAIALTIMCPPLGFVISLYALFRDFENWKTYIFCIAWGMAVFAYCYEPTTASDLVRYYAYVKSLRGASLSEAINIGQYGSDNLYSFVFVCWFVNLLGDIHLLPAISTFCIYYIGLYVTYRVGCDIDVNKKIIFKYAILILMSISFYGIVNNVRNIWAFTLIGAAVFRDVYLKRRNIFTIFLYIAPVFLHTSAVVFIIIRLIMIAPKKIKIAGTILCFTVPLALNVLSTRLAGVASGNIIIKILLSMVQSGNNYFEHTTNAWSITVQNSGSERLARILFMTIAVLMIVMYFVIVKNSNTKDKTGMITNKSLTSMIDFPFLACLLTLSCSTMVMPEYWRFVAIAILFGGTIYLSYSENSRITVFQNIQLVFAAVAFILCVRNLINYSNLPLMIERSFLANPVLIMIFNLIGPGIEMII